MQSLQDVREISVKTGHRFLGRVLSRLVMPNGGDCTVLLRTIQMLSRHKELNCFVGDIVELLEDPDHPASAFFERFLTSMTPNGRRRLFQTLIYNSLIRGHQIRKRLTEEHGIANFPYLLVLSPTNRCNLQCRGCYASGYGLADSLPLPLVKRILGECEDLGIFLVVLSGGEPFVYPHTLDLIEQYPHVLFHIYTNGTLITSQVAERLSRMGNVIVVISIEGFQGNTDQRRGAGVFEEILTAFQRLRQSKVPFGTSTTVTRQNLEEVISSPFLNFLVDQGALVNYYFMYVPVDGNGDFSSMLSPRQRDRLRAALRDIRGTTPLLVIGFWNDGPYVRGCIAAGRRYFHVNARGDIEPCVFTHFATDNVNDTTLLQAIKSPLFTDIRARQPYDSNHLCPCMIIDSPWVARDLIQTHGARATHPGALSIYNEQYDRLLDFAQEYRCIAERAWQEEWHGKGFFE
jgi:MoaA/NifB/PqqE/SkfB family radical SAM enzyme